MRAICTQFRRLGTNSSRLLRAWRLVLLFLVVAHLFPIRTGILRLAMVIGVALVWFGVPLVFQRRRWVTAVWAVITLLFTALLLGPGRPDDPHALTQEYVKSLNKYIGVRYIWGGENSRGVDCSGLVRIGLIDADVNRGLITLNPQLIREAISLWWHDCSANALMHEYRKDTIVQLDAASLNQLDYSQIAPGDLAITESGQHVMAYIGNNRWIAADPLPMRVRTYDAPSRSVWFDQQMRIVRWRQLR